MNTYIKYTYMYTLNVKCFIHCEIQLWPDFGGFERPGFKF